MPTQESASETAVLERLRADEATLDRALEEARQAARRVVAEARELAARQGGEAATRLAQELKVQAAALEMQCVAIRRDARDEAARRVRALAELASRRLDAAVALVVAAVEATSP